MTTDVGVLWLIVVAGGVGTFMLRASFIVVVGRVDEIPSLIERGLQFVPAAVLAALVIPAIVAVDASGGPATLPVVTYSPKLPAAALAALVAWKTENVPATIAVGMAALWTLEAL